MDMQELARIPGRRPKLLQVLKVEDPDRQGAANLAAFNERLWAMTVMPLRYFREVALWLFRYTASMQMGQGNPLLTVTLSSACSARQGCLKTHV